MARNTMDFAQHNTERAVQATTWMRTIAEQNLNRSKAALEGLLTFTRNAVRSVDQQSSAICDHSIAVAEETLSNAFEIAHKGRDAFKCVRDCSQSHARERTPGTRSNPERLR